MINTDIDLPSSVVDVRLCSVRVLLLKCDYEVYCCIHLCIKQIYLLINGGPRKVLCNLKIVVIIDNYT